MSYLSEVAIACPAERLNQILASCRENGFDAFARDITKSIVRREGDYAICHLANYKWYESDKDIGFFMKLLRQKDDFEFLRLGEEIGDIESLNRCGGLSYFGVSWNIEFL